MDYRAIEATNTKTRRLAYLQALTLILKNRTYTRPQLLEKIANWNKANLQDLKSYWVTTGEVTSTRQNSAGSRYIDLAMGLGVIAHISGVYRCTRLGRVLITLLDQTEENTENAFQLTIASRMFFTYLLLQKDADLLLLLTDSIESHTKLSLAPMQRQFKELFLERLNLKIELSSDEKTRRILIDRRREVDAWKKPERYAEHLIPPRLNWLLDLLWLDPEGFAQHTYSFTQHGSAFVRSFPLLDKKIRDIDTSWLENDFWLSLPKLVENSNARLWTELPLSEKVTLAANLLRIAFKSFRLTGVPRISRMPTLLYICLSLSNIGITVTPKQFSDWLAQNQKLENARYEVRTSPRENESYIVVRIG